MIELALLELEIGGGAFVDPSVVHVVAETDGTVLIGGVIVNRPVFCGGEERNACIDLNRRPRPQAFANLFGKTVGIGSRFEDFLRHLPCHLMVAVAVGRSADETGSNDERTCHAHDAHGIGQDAVIAPFLDAFFAGFGEAVVNDGAPVLVNTVIAIGLQKLLSAQQTEFVIHIDRHGILTALAARQGHKGGAGATATRFRG